MAGLDALDLDAQPQPPDGELGEAEEAIGTGERNALSERRAAGRPRSRNSLSKAVIAGSSLVDSSASQSNRKREA
jgi:hypothetical protein